MKDPTHEIMKAYYDALNGNVTYDGDDIYVGTKIPSDEKNYIYIYVESLQDKGSGTQTIFEAIVTMDIVTRLDLNSGNEEMINDITDQVIGIVTDVDQLSFTNFQCLLSQLYGMDRNSENTDTDYITSRKLRIKNFIQQI